ncbi:MAG: ankyrin repeat domain-containing protein, partial [Alphaproteobacteria bacterium]|nr:ankyrin repeat domain-containing protein [Alphaproteobacteria bacterium]
MQFAFVRELRVRRRRGFGIDLLAMTLTAGLAVTALAQDISPATTRLFDAVWADDLGRVKAAITAGASISAVNELGVRPVDMAVDRGHFGIAHYLLSVEKQRRDA